MILDKINELLKEVETLSAQNAEEVEQLRLKYLSKKGEITALMNDFRNVAADQKKMVGIKLDRRSVSFAFIIRQMETFPIIRPQIGCFDTEAIRLFP